MSRFSQWNLGKIGPAKTDQKQLQQTRAEYEKQLADQRGYAAELRAELRDARLTLRENDQAFQNIRDIRHKLMGSRALSELLRALLGGLEGLNVDYVGVTLVRDFMEPESALAVSLGDEVKGRLRFKEKRFLERMLCPFGGPKAYIGATGLKETPGLFSAEIKSCVLLPLVHQAKLIGCLNLGSLSPSRFPSDYSLDLLEDLAATAAISLDNVITHERNKRLATTDSLTRIYNRRFFQAQGARAFALARRHGDALACIYIDLNDFKPINDRYGHETGDLALKKLAWFVRRRIRQTDIFARLGGDEFGLLLPRVKMHQALRVAEWLREGIGKISFADEGYPDLTISAAFGVATIEADDSRFIDLMNRADAAMYEDKGQKPQRGRSTG